MKNVSNLKYNNVLLQCSNEQVNNIRSLSYGIIANGNITQYEYVLNCNGSKGQDDKRYNMTTTIDINNQRMERAILK